MRDLSIVVGVLMHNAVSTLRFGLLERTLTSIREAFPHSHVVAFDNGSTDGTADAVKELPAAPLVITYEAEDGNHGPARGRNELAKHLVRFGTYLIVFSDDDIVWRPFAGRLLSDLWNGVRTGIHFGGGDEPLALVSGLLEPEYPWSSKLGEELLGGVPVEYRLSAPAATWAMPRTHWERVGPFPEDGDLGEDVQVCQRLHAAGYRMGQVALAEHIGQGYSLCGNDLARDMFSVATASTKVDTVATSGTVGAMSSARGAATRVRAVVHQHWTETDGLTDDGARLAEQALPLMMDAVKLVGAELAHVVLMEAVYRLVELPKRTKGYQRAYLRAQRSTSCSGGER